MLNINEQTLELLNLDTLAQMNANFEEVYETTKNQDAREAARLVYRIGCKKAGSEKEYQFELLLAHH